MSDLSAWSRAALMDWLMGGTPPTRPTGYEVSLHTGDPGVNGASDEVGAGVGYAREAATFTGSAGAYTNDGNITFGPATGAGWGTVTHVAIWDTGAGNCLWKGPLDDAQLVVAGIPYTIVAGDLDTALPA